MVRMENHLGKINVAHSYFVNLVGSAVVDCYGVAAMGTAGLKQTFTEKLIKKPTLDKGITVRVRNDKMYIDIHIIVTYGTNITAIVRSIMHKVKYIVEEKTGFQVSRVNIYIDGMQN